MKNKITLVVLIVLFVLLIGGAYLLYNTLGQDVDNNQLQLSTTQDTQPSDEPSRPANPAPEFTVYDKDGNAVQFSDYVGKPIVLNFWASWCPPCRSEMPHFEQKFQEYGDEVQFLMINATDGSRETVDTASDFLQQNGYTFPVLFDSDMDAAIAYRAYSLPTTIFIDAAGNVVANAVGAISGDQLQAGIHLIYTPQ